MQTLRQQYEVNSFLVNPQRRLGLYALLNILQDAGWAHGFALGLGREDELHQKIAWVLGRQRVVMRSWPKWGDVVEVETWLRPPARSTVNRDNIIRVGGEQIGEATTVVLMIDQTTRKTVRTDTLQGKIPFHTDERFKLDAVKLEPQTAGMATLARFDVRNSDLDMNQHVNNTRYAQWILDSIPIDWHRRFLLTEYDNNSRAETRPGDAVSIQNGDGGRFQGVRAGDDKVVFTARMVIDTAGS
jgi:acyl-ACP thioesterase